MFSLDGAAASERGASRAFAGETRSTLFSIASPNEQATAQKHVAIPATSIVKHLIVSSPTTHHPTMAETEAPAATAAAPAADTKKKGGARKKDTVAGAAANRTMSLRKREAPKPKVEEAKPE